MHAEEMSQLEEKWSKKHRDDIEDIENVRRNMQTRVDELEQDNVKRMNDFTKCEDDLWQALHSEQQKCRELERLCTDQASQLNELTRNMDESVEKCNAFKLKYEESLNQSNEYKSVCEEYKVKIDEYEIACDPAGYVPCLTDVNFWTQIKYTWHW